MLLFEYHVFEAMKFAADYDMIELPEAQQVELIELRIKCKELEADNEFL